MAKFDKGKENLPEMDMHGEYIQIHFSLLENRPKTGPSS
jgi:hypothetical protein